MCAHPAVASTTNPCRYPAERSGSMPLGELRKKNREMGAPESEELLGRALVGRLGTVGPDGMPYVVPMNFVYDPAVRTVFLHCANTGHRLDNLAHNPLACFEVDEPEAILATGTRACDTSQIYRSVICFGKAIVVSDREEKERALRLFVTKYVDGLMPERRYEPVLTTLDQTTVIALRVETMTGKKRTRQ